MGRKGTFQGALHVVDNVLDLSLLVADLTE